ncbi:MAG: oligosaccharide flippase family protein [Methylococcaceae bacterium]
MSYSSFTKKNIVNLVSLTCIQFSNALLPVIAFPLILNVVGADFFSKIVLTEAVALIIVALVLYSFEVEGISKIVGLNMKTDISKISHIFSGILYVRLMIWLLCVVILCLLFPILDQDIFTLLVSWMLFPLSYIFHSYWFYQGIERNIFPAVLTFTTRLLCLIFLIKFITQPSEYYLVPIIIGTTYGISGLTSLIYVLIKHKIKLVKLTSFEIKHLLFSGKEIFFGIISVTLFRNSNVIILGLLSNSAAVSVYSIAEKSIKIFQAGARPLNQLFFPKVIRSISQMKTPDTAAFKTILKYTIPQLVLLSFAAILITLFYIFSRHYLPSKFNFSHENEIVYLVSIMVVAVLFGVSNFMFGMAGLNYLNKKGYFTKAIFVTGIFSIFCCVTLVLWFSEVGAALSFIFSEMFLFILVSKTYFRKKM